MVGCSFDLENNQIIAKCFECGRVFSVRCVPEQWEQVKAGKPISEVFSDASRDAKEALRSGICGKCSDELFNDMQEDD